LVEDAPDRLPKSVQAVRMFAMSRLALLDFHLLNTTNI
jgi:hypothetical protein